MDSEEDDALYLAIEMVEDLPLDGGMPPKQTNQSPELKIQWEMTGLKSLHS